jgi:hypothetical protein
MCRQGEIEVRFNEVDIRLNFKNCSLCLRFFGDFKDAALVSEEQPVRLVGLAGGETEISVFESSIKAGPRCVNWEVSRSEDAIAVLKHMLKGGVLELKSPDSEK